MASAPRYVLSERAANALRALIAPGSAYGARPRPVRTAAADARPCLFDLRDDGTALQVFVGDDLVGANCAVRVNGLSVAFADPGTIVDGWWPLARSTAVWIEFAAPAGASDPEQNWPPEGATPPRAPLVATLVARNLAEDASPSWPGDRAYHRVLLWYRQLGTGGSWWNPRNGPWVRAGGVDITVDIADGDLVGSGGVGSLAHNEHGRVGLVGFRSAARRAWPTLAELADAEYSIIVRLKTSAGAGLRYLNANGVVVHTGNGNIRVGTDTYAPTQITVDGQTITILAKQ